MRWMVLAVLLLTRPVFAVELQVEPLGFWWLRLTCPTDQQHSSALRVRTTITQPRGYAATIEATAKVKNGRAEWDIVYPLIDEGRYDEWPEIWDGGWVMGQYEFHAELIIDDEVASAFKTEFDQTSLCPSDSYGPILTLYPQQFIECSPDRPAYIDTDRMSFSIRTMPERVEQCTVVVDVIAREGKEILAGPWELSLDGDGQHLSFDSAGWTRGEYWIRIRVQSDGEPVGPYLIRKVWKEILPPEVEPGQPLQLGTATHLVTGPLEFSEVNNVHFVSDPLVKRPDGPLVEMDRPWESELMLIKDISHDKDHGGYRMLYEIGLGEKAREVEFASLPSQICVAYSRDGEIWEKPDLGLLEYQGSRSNNLLPEEFAISASGERVGKLGRGEAFREGRLAHDYDAATFRLYNADRDGPVDMDNFFVSAVKRPFIQHCPNAAKFGFKNGSYPMEKRGDEYLVLTAEPILYLGAGMDLYHTTESIRLHVEDKSTGTCYYFFRPGSPSYAPHDCPYDNMHMTRRCLGVMWTSDGIHWDRRHIAVPDEFDPAGAEFYVITLFAGSEETLSGRSALALERQKFNIAIEGGRPYMGAFYLYDAKANRIWPEAVWTRDLLHWHRFDDRKKMIANGPPGSHDYGQIRIRSHYFETGDEWWFPYSAINGLHQEYIGLGRFTNVDDFRDAHPQYSGMPNFEDWEQFFESCKRCRYYPAIGRCPRGRLSHAEPVEESGSLTTQPMLLCGDALVINASTDKNGSIRVEILDVDSQPIAGFGRNECLPMTGDWLSHSVEWNDGEIAKLRGETVRVLFLLEQARLYSFAANSKPSENQ